SVDAAQAGLSHQLPVPALVYHDQVARRLTRRLRNGIDHGLYCVGCCWMLMALLFVAGVMNLMWVAALAIVVLVEKVVPGGERIARVIGIGLVATGVVLIVGAWQVP